MELPGAASEIMAGMIHSKVNLWLDLKSVPFVCSVVANGFNPPCIFTPNQTFRKSHSVSTEVHHSFVSSEIEAAQIQNGSFAVVYQKRNKLL